MSIRYKRINGTEIIEEICEHCNVKVRDLHISDIAIKPDNDPRTITVKSGSSNIEAKTMSDILTDKKDDWVRRGLMASGDTKPLYKARPAMMCSESIDTTSGVTASYCYKTDNAAFLAKYSSSYHASSEIKYNITGSKVGVDRLGNIIRVRSTKKLDEADSRLVYHGGDKTSWWRTLNESHRKTYIPQAQTCTRLIDTYGLEQVHDMSVVENFRNLADWDAYMSRNCR